MTAHQLSPARRFAGPSVPRTGIRPLGAAGRAIFFAVAVDGTTLQRGDGAPSPPSAAVAALRIQLCAILFVFLANAVTTATTMTAPAVDRYLVPRTRCNKSARSYGFSGEDGVQKRRSIFVPVMSFLLPFSTGAEASKAACAGAVGADGALTALGAQS